MGPLSSGSLFMEDIHGHIYNLSGLGVRTISAPPGVSLDIEDAVSGQVMVRNLLETVATQQEYIAHVHDQLVQQAAGFASLIELVTTLGPKAIDRPTAEAIRAIINNAKITSK